MQLNDETTITETRRRPRHMIPLGAPIDRLPPHDLAAEQAVMGCVLLDPRECIPAISALPDGLFYDLRHETIFDACRSLADENIPVDEVTVMTRLQKRGQLEGIGGVAYLTSLPEATPSAHNVEYYLDILLDLATRRKVIAEATKAVSAIYEGDTDGVGILDSLQQSLSEIANGIVGEVKRDMPTLVAKAVEELERDFNEGDQVNGVPTGIPDLDRMTNGLQPGDMIVIAARPSCGKTSIAMNIAEHVAVNMQLPVGVFSLEMSAQALVKRVLCSRAEVNRDTFKAREATERDFYRLTTASSQLVKANLHIDDTRGLSIMQLRARARRMHLRYGIKLLVIDYLQLLKGSKIAAKQGREREVADISNGIKTLAGELNVPVIILAQINREFEKDKHRKPRMSDLRESGAIEQDADLIGMLYDPSEEPRGHDELIVPVNMLVAKQRNGRTGDVHLTFFKAHTRFKPRASDWMDGEGERSNGSAKPKSWGDR